MKTKISQIAMFKRGIAPMKKILLFTLFIFTIQSLSANSISVQGVLRDNNNRAVPDKEEGYNMTFTIYSDSLGGSLVWGPTTYNGVDVLNGVYSLELNVGTELQTSTDELWLDVVVEDSQMGSRVRLHLSPYEHLAYSGDSNAFPSAGDVGIGTLTPTEKLEVNGNVKAEFYYGSAEFMDNIWADDIQDNAITSAKILDETITSSDIGPNAVGQSELGSNAVTTAHIDDNAVTTSDIKNGEVQWADIANNNIYTSHIVDGEIKWNDIANDNIYGYHIVDGEVAKADLAPGAEALSSWTVVSETFDDLYYEWTGSGWAYSYISVDCGEEGGMVIASTANYESNISQPYNTGGLRINISDTSGPGYGYHTIISHHTYEFDQMINFTVPCVRNKSMKVQFGKYGSFINAPAARVVSFTY